MPNKRKAFPSIFKKSASAVDNTSGGSALQKLFWLEEFLTHDIPEARVWTYGYNADVIGCFKRTIRTVYRNTVETLR